MYRDRRPTSLLVNRRSFLSCNTNKGGGALEYQYAITDQQGNTRVVFSSVIPTAAPTTATFEDAVADSKVFKNVNTSTMYWVSKSGANNTAGGQYVLRMNNSYTAGPAKSLKVFPGDAVNMEVWSYFEGTSGFGANDQPLTTLITAVASAFGGVSGAPGESDAIFNGVSSAYTASGLPINQSDADPTAHLNYILFDKNYNVLDMGWQGVPSTANFAKQKLTFTNPITIKEAGYMYIYLSYEGTGTNWVYFDDFKIIHTKTDVIQYSEYYPFGLQAGTSWTRDDAISNNFLYNEGSEMNTTTSWYDLPFRNYDPTLGRFVQVDPLATKNMSYSGYHYGFNNPVLFTDPTGADPSSGPNLPNYAGGYPPWGTPGYTDNDGEFHWFDPTGDGAAYAALGMSQTYADRMQLESFSKSLDIWSKKDNITLKAYGTFLQDANGNEVDGTRKVDGWYVQEPDNTPGPYMASALVISTGLLADDATVVLTLDDILIPFLIGAAYLADKYGTAGKGNENYPGPWTYTVPDPTAAPPPYEPPSKFPGKDPSGFVKGTLLTLGTLDLLRRMGGVNPELDPNNYSLRPFKSLIENTMTNMNDITNEVKFKTSQGIYDTNHWTPGVSKK